MQYIIVAPINILIANFQHREFTISSECFPFNSCVRHDVLIAKFLSAISVEAKYSPVKLSTANYCIRLCVQVGTNETKNNHLGCLKTIIGRY